MDDNSFEDCVLYNHLHSCYAGICFVPPRPKHIFMCDACGATIQGEPTMIGARCATCLDESGDHRRMALYVRADEPA